MCISQPALVAPWILAYGLCGAAGAQDEPKSMFGEPLVIDGHQISDMEIKRFLCYGKGRNALESRRLGILIRQEKELRHFDTRREVCGELFEGKPFGELSADQAAEVDAAVAERLAYMNYDEAEYKRRLKDHADLFGERYPTLELGTETRRAYQSEAWYEDQVRQTLEFETIFFPDHPDTWPEITIEAIQGGSPNFDLVADYAKHYQWRLEAAEESGEPIKREEEMMMGLLRDYVMGALASLVEIKTQSDGLPPEVLMTITGGGFEAMLMTDDVYEEMKHVFAEQDVWEAKRCLGLQRAALVELEKVGVLRDREEFFAEISETREELEGSLFNWNFLALQGHMFPSEEAFNEQAYLIDSFKKLVEEQVTRNETGNLTEELRAHLAKANIVMGLGRCRAEILFVSAFDFPAYRWKENGWQAAEDKAFELRSQLDAHLDSLAVDEASRQRALAEGSNFESDEDLVPFDRFWSHMLDLNSEYWDPPMPMTGKGPPAMSLLNRGRFTEKPSTRNDFKRGMGESDYQHFLLNTSVTDHVFFKMDPGSYAGPLRGPKGYYIPYLVSRQRPTNPLDLATERHWNLLVDDYVRTAFRQFAHDALEASK